MAFVAMLLPCTPVQAQEMTPTEENMASDMWASAFAWLQTGKNLAQLEQWPLAMSSYSESLKQFTAVVEKYPKYEPEILAYRIEKLKEMINETKSKLDASDHEISMLYGDTIEMIEKGENLRFQVEDFGEAYKTMNEAKALITEVVEKRPVEFATAMKSQIDRIQSNIDWLSFQLGYASRPKTKFASVYTSGTVKMMGTTEFIGEKDLPGDPEEAGISSALFPAQPGLPPEATALPD